MESRYLAFFFLGRETVSEGRCQKRPLKVVDSAKGRSLEVSQGIPSSADRASMSSKL
jgi:hypothetical protein